MGKCVFLGFAGMNVCAFTFKLLGLKENEEMSD